MSIEVDVLCEVYSTLKQYIPQKDRQEASDTLMSLMVDVLSDSEVKIFGSMDKYTKQSLDEYFGDDTNDWEDDYED